MDVIFLATERQLPIASILLAAGDDGAAKFVAFNERVRCHRRRSHQPDARNPKKLVEKNCTFLQCDGCPWTAMRAVAKAHQAIGPPLIFLLPIRIETMRAAPCCCRI